jgi:hypothetical protein
VIIAGLLVGTLAAPTDHPLGKGDAERNPAPIDELTLEIRQAGAGTAAVAGHDARASRHRPRANV